MPRHALPADNRFRCRAMPRPPFSRAFPWARLLMPLCALLFLPLAALPLPARAAAQNPFWSTGTVQVFAIQDRPAEMPVELFSGPASDEERRQYFRDGKASASINAFLLRIGGKNILVDTGYGAAAPEKGALVPALAALGFAPESVDIVLLSHMHPDHAGGLLNNGKRAFPEASVMVCGTELEYWLDLAEESPDNANAALVKTIVDVYGKSILPPFAPGDALLPGVTALDASGHTPGHTVFLVESEDKRLLIIGDLLHAAALQFPLPEECAVYDMDKEKAVQSRVKILEMAAEQAIPVAGMHIPYPGCGSVAKHNKGFIFLQANTKK